MHALQDQPTRSSRTAPAFMRACRLVWSLIMILVLLAGYLAVVGLPPSVTQRVSDGFAEHGYDVRLDRIRLNFLHGLVAENVRWTITAEDRVPALSVPRVVLGFDPRAWLQGDVGLQHLRFEGGTVLLPSQPPLIASEGPGILTLADIKMDCRVEPAGLRVALLETTLGPLQITGRGFIVRGTSGERRPLAWPVEQAQWLSFVSTALASIHTDDPVRVHYDFMLNPLHPELTRFSAKLMGEKTRYRGLNFDEWSADIKRSNATDIRGTVRALAAGKMVSAEADWSIAKQEITLRLESSLIPVYWRNLLPDAARNWMDRVRLYVHGDTRLTLVCGPASLDHLMKTISGSFSAEHVQAQGAWLEKVTAEFTRAGDQLTVNPIQAVLGQGAQQGPAQGEIHWNLASHDYHGHVTASFDPSVVLPLAEESRQAAEIIQAVVLTDALPEVDGTFSGGAYEGGLFNFTGKISGDRFSFRGAYVDRFETMFDYTNHVMRLDPLYVRREEGELRGWYEQDFAHHLTRLDVTSGVDPKAIARVGGAHIEKILRPFHFKGPIQGTVRGTVDYGTQEKTDYIAQAHGEQVGWSWVTADTCAMDWIAQGDRVLMTNLVISLYGGKAEGWIELTGIGNEPVNYETHLEAQDVRFEELLVHARQQPGLTGTGDLSARIELRGKAEDDWKASVQGKGTIRIRDGLVFQIPLLGDLSRLLSRLYSGLGFATQSDLRARYTISDRHIRSEEIRIEGALLSLKGWGSYDLDDQLDFKVQVQPLRRGWLVDAVRIVTYPVSKLLQFRLIGSLENPDWRIDNLPRELWGLFEGSEEK